jgi:hypothetical protein
VYVVSVTVATGVVVLFQNTLIVLPLKFISIVLQAPVPGAITVPLARVVVLKLELTISSDHTP